MSLETNSFGFGEFRLDADEKVLSRHGEPISITPKAFQLLFVLVKNHGHPVKKNDLMREVWADSFVEDGNLTFTVNLLRKVLGDEKKHPRFIETIPKVGYRFSGEVKEFVAEEEAVNAVETQKSTDDFGKYKSLSVSVIILLVAVISFGFWYRTKHNSDVALPILSQPFAVEKLSFNGKVKYAVISSDGKNVIYTNQINGKQSLWLRQLESGNNAEIIPPSDDFYYGLAISPDGNFVYFSRLSPEVEGQGNIYRISIFGGIPQKIINQAQGWMSISSDGAKISFVRCYYRDDEFCSLWLADAVDGMNERKLVVRPRPLRIGGNQISPDGKSIVFATGQSVNQANEFSLNEINLENGTERELTSQKFFNIKEIISLPEKNGWLITARTNAERNFRIWQISATGEAVPLTKDSEIYSVLSLDKDFAQMVSIQSRREIWSSFFQVDNPSVTKTLTGIMQTAFATDGKLIVTSDMTANSDIWSLNPDGSEPRQLTNNADEETTPIVLNDNSRIFFNSNQTGESQLWRMNRDGTNQIQITKKEGGFPLFVSTDGMWIYYQHGLSKTLWRVSLVNGEEQLVLNKVKYRFAIAPDGTQVAFSEKKGEENRVMIVSLPNGKIVKTFPMAEKNRISEIVWMADGKSLAYISQDQEHKNNVLWSQALSGGLPQRISDLGDDEILHLALSSDGKTVAVGRGKWLHDAVLIKGLK